MRRIVYYVAISLDGYISGKDGDISGFTAQGDGVDQYLQDLQSYDTVIMGRNTYEFGYDFGLIPGQLAYPHMTHYVIASKLEFNDQHQNLHIIDPSLEEIDKIQQQSGTDIYLCGGGQLAGWLLDHQKIDILKIKLNPMLLGSGIRLFGSSETFYQLELLDSKRYQQGLQIITYKVLY